MNKYLIRTIKLPDHMNSGDHIHEEDWLYVDADKIHTINIFGKEFGDISNLKAEPKHAHVISDEDGNMKCSNCGSGNCFDNYCGHCGAKLMEAESGRLVRCKDCKRFRLSTMYKNWGLCLLAKDEGHGVYREVRGDSYCSEGLRKDEVENGLR